MSLLYFSFKQIMLPIIISLYIQTIGKIFLEKPFLLHRMLYYSKYTIIAMSAEFSTQIYNINHCRHHAVFKTDSPLVKDIFYREYIELCQFYHKIGH